MMQTPIAEDPVERETAVVDRLDKTSGSGHCAGMQIDHDPHEPQMERGPGPWRWLFPAIGLLWVGNLFYFPIDWRSVALGGGTGIVFALWSIEITGNKVPDWWKSKPPRSGRS